LKKKINYIGCVFLLINMLSCQHDADNYKIKGIDVSHYQEEIDWKTVATNEDLHFVFMKATEGGNYQDSTFSNNWKEARKTNLLRGAYHFFRPKPSASKQVKNFTSLVRISIGDLPPVLDIEEIELPDTTLMDKIAEWLMLAEEHYKIKPIIYASLNLYQEHLKVAFPEHIVWLARYNRTAPPMNTTWKFWQFSNQGYVQGIKSNVDMNVFNGSLNDLVKLCKGGQRRKKNKSPFLHSLF